MVKEFELLERLFKEVVRIRKEMRLSNMTQIVKLANEAGIYEDPESLKRNVVELAKLAEMKTDRRR